MNYTFDTKIERIGSEATKYEDIPYKNIPEVNFPLWVADMDYETAPEIMEVLLKRMEHRIFGYYVMGDRYYDSIINWHKSRYGVNFLEKKHIHYQNSVLAGVCHVLNLFTNEGDGVLVHSPTYPGFTKVIQNMNRIVIPNALIEDENGYFTIDYKSFEETIIKEKIKVHIFCNPHNPTGRIWTKEEMTQIVDICLKHNVAIISDEIWSDMIIDQEKRHLPLVLADARAKEIAVSMYSPSKGYNLAGMVSSYSICYNDELAKKVELSSEYLHCNQGAVLAVDSTIAAYEVGQPWLDACVDYISKNMDYIIEFLKTRLPKITCQKPEATYLLWLDFSKLGISHEEMLERAINRAGFIANDGRSFFQNGDLRMRVNPTSSRSFIKEALLALEREFKDIAK